MQHTYNSRFTNNQNAQTGFNIHLLVFVLATPATWIAWLLTDTTYPWPLWSTGTWAVGVLSHYLAVRAGKKAALKKNLLSSVLVLMLGLGTAFAAPVSPANEKITSAFKNDFATAQAISWEKAGEHAKATFTLNGQVLYAWYTEAGKQVAVIRHMLSGQLPISLLAELKNNYSDFWISELFELVADGSTSYYITIEDPERRIVLRSQGNSHWELYKKTNK